MNTIMRSCGLESKPRWIMLENHGAWIKCMCSSCGNVINMNCKKIIEACPNCKSQMKKLVYF